MLPRILALLIFAFVLLPWGWTRRLVHWPQSPRGKASAKSAWDRPHMVAPGRR